MFIFYLGTFLVSSFPALVLFDSGTIQSFVLLSFSRSFNVALVVLEYPLRVSINDEHKVSATSVFCDFVLKIFWGAFSQLTWPLS